MRETPLFLYSLYPVITRNWDIFGDSSYDMKIPYPLWT